MDSDDSYETTSEVFREMDTEQFSSSSQESTNRESGEIRELYASTFSGPRADNATLENPVAMMTEKIKEQSILIHSLKGERIGFLEQITQLCGALEDKERELMEFMQLYEQKANDVAQYMQEVQDLLAQLTDLFSDQLLHGHSVKNNGSLPMHQPQKTEASEGKLSNCLSSATSPGTAWDQRGRELLHALSESVATASARNKEATLPRPTTAEHANTNSEEIRNPVAIRGTKKQQNSNSVAMTTLNGIHLPIEEDHPDPLEVTVCHLPPLCWSPDHVLYWLTEYACLPGGCLEVAKRIRLDGRQLTTLPGGKLDKMLCLSDPGLQRKLQLSLEDLRVHGSPGVSHCPGPSHIRPHWVCEVWLRRYLGLAQFAPAFAVRRVDGRMLASLAIYKASKRTSSSLTGAQIEVKHQDANPVPPTGVLHPANIPNGTTHGCSTPAKSASGIWYGASRKELCRILLGISRDNSGNGVNVSGAELPPTAKFLLGKREACSLRTGIELLRRFDFNIEMLEKAQQQCEDVDDNLLVWTNERVAKWLRGLGLQEFTQGIEGTGLHGAYMVLDPQFDTNRLMKYIHLPANVASSYQLDLHLQALLKPARLREGNLCTKQPSFFRRRSLSRSGRAYLMQRSITSSNAMGYDMGFSNSTLTRSKLDCSKASASHPGSPLYTVNGATALSKKCTQATKEDKFGFTHLHLRRNPTMLQHEKTALTSTKTALPLSTLGSKSKPAPARGEQNAKRLVRVFSRGRIPDTMTSDCRTSAATSDADSGLGTSEDRSGALVRKVSMSANSVETASRSPLAKRLVFKKSPSPTDSESKRPAYIREGVQPCEAPLIDPLSSDAWRGRIRIKLNQSARSVQLNSNTTNDVSGSPKPVHQQQTEASCIPFPPSPTLKSWHCQTQSELAHLPPDAGTHTPSYTGCNSPTSLTLSSVSSSSHRYSSSHNAEPN